MTRGFPPAGTSWSVLDARREPSYGPLGRLFCTQLRMQLRIWRTELFENMCYGRFGSWKNPHHVTRSAANDSKHLRACTQPMGSLVPPSPYRLSIQPLLWSDRFRCILLLFFFFPGPSSFIKVIKQLHWLCRSTEGGNGPWVLSAKAFLEITA